MVREVELLWLGAGGGLDGDDRRAWEVTGGRMPRAMKRAVTSAAEYGVARAGIAAAHALDHDVSGQNRQPTGAAGRVAAWEMTLRPSNRQRSAWVVSLLNVQPADQVLEIGFGPGLAIAALVRAGAGQVYGIDHSAVMLRQASRRNAAAIRAGRVTLLRASVDQLPPAVNGPFAAISRSTPSRSGLRRRSGSPSCGTGSRRAGALPSRLSPAAPGRPPRRPAAPLAGSKIYSVLLATPGPGPRPSTWTLPLPASSPSIRTRPRRLPSRRWSRPSGHRSRATGRSG